MPFISNEVRQDLIKKTNSKAIFRKSFIIASICLLLIVVAIIAAIAIGWLVNTNQLHSKGLSQQEVWIEMCKKWWSPFVIQNPSAIETGQPLKLGLSGFSWFAIVLFVVAIGGSITSLVFVITFKSPKMVKEDIKVLEGAPLGGKSTEDLSPIEVVRQRRKPIKEVKNKR